MASSIFKTIAKIPKIQLLFYFLLFILIINIISGLNLRKNNCQIEGFMDDYKKHIGDNDQEENEEYENEEDSVNKDNNNLYDRFYAKIYDELLFSKVKNDFEIGEFKNRTAPDEQSNVLDIGSGTGHHVSSLVANGFNKVIGIDKSRAMIEYSKKMYPELDFRQADALEASTFSSSSFTHITCFYFTIYYMQNKKQFFDNCMYWLKPGGYLAIHLVDRDNFDPILPAGDPFKIISPQNYTNKRITSTVVKFDDFDYKSNFEVFPNDDTAIMGEVFKFKSKNVENGKRKMRRNEHKFYMPTQKQILNMAKQVGFIVLAEVDMLRCQYSHQYIYILQKPN